MKKFLSIIVWIIAGMFLIAAVFAINRGDVKFSILSFIFTIYCVLAGIFFRKKSIVPSSESTNIAKPIYRRSWVWLVSFIMIFIVLPVVMFPVTRVLTERSAIIRANKIQKSLSSTEIEKADYDNNEINDDALETDDDLSEPVSGNGIEKDDQLIIETPSVDNEANPDITKNTIDPELFDISVNFIFDMIDEEGYIVKIETEASEYYARVDLYVSDSLYWSYLPESDKEDFIVNVASSMIELATYSGYDPSTPIENIEVAIVIHSEKGVILAERLSEGYIFVYE